MLAACTSAVSKAGLMYIFFISMPSLLNDDFAATYDVYSALGGLACHAAAVQRVPRIGGVSG